MRYAGIIFNDIAAAPGVCLTFFTQGCSHHCPGCHNPETWDFDGGKEFTPDTLNDIIEGL
jgi:anaerobic ribonucleoside-triphosphate reductase activating protein